MEENKTTKIGTELLVEALHDQGVEVVFGYPGGAVLHIYDQFFRSNENHILARHEQGAGHMADGYARATGKTGVAIATSGPGATNLVTAVATAQMDSVPMVVITGQVADSGIGKDAFQETDIVGVMTPVTKYAYQVRQAKDIPRTISEAFYIANSGRKGPVLVDIPKNIGIEVVDTENIKVGMQLPGYTPDDELNIDIDVIQEIMATIGESKKPLILAGNGISKSQASEELRTFAHTYQIPVVQTLLGLGVMDSKDDLSLGMAGMHGTYAANMALMETDCLINIGSRFDDRVASDPSNFAPHAKIIHIDIDPSEIDKIIETDISLVADASIVLQLMLQFSIENYTVKQEWLNHQADNKSLHPTQVPVTGEHIRPQRVLEYLGEKTNGDALIATDVGQHQMWAAQYYPFKFPGQLITSGGLGTMGYGIPAAIGADYGAAEGQTVVSIVGDGGFQMTNQELNVMQHYGMKPKFIILNNTVLGMVHQWQHTFYEDRYSHSEFGQGLPDFVKLSEALGVTAARVSDPAEMEAAVDVMLAFDGPYVLEVMIDKHELVTPMVASGKSNDQMEGLS